MEKNLTLIILTPQFIETNNLPKGIDTSRIEVLQQTGIFDSVKNHHYNCMQAISKVKTKYFTFVDNDDYLLDDALSCFDEVINLLDTTHYDLGYTNYYTKDNTKIDPGTKMPTMFLHNVGKYVESKAYANLTYLHHGVICRTNEAKRVVSRMPLGEYYTPPMIYITLAKLGTVYVPKPTYVWDKKNSGLHLDSDMKQKLAGSIMWLLKTIGLPDGKPIKIEPKK